MEFYDKEVVLYSKRAVAKFEECRQNLKFCDVTLQSGQVEVKAHRIVLVAASPYFEALFKDGLQEHKELVNCSDIPSDVLPSLVDFLYTGHLTIQSSTARELMATAHMLCLDGLVTGCARYLKTQLNTSNALSMLSFAETLGCSKLSEYALDYIGEHWTIIAQRKELLELSLIVFIRILCSDRFVPDNELEVVFAVVRWLEYKPTARAPHCSELVRHLHLGRIPADVLDEMWRIVRDTRVAEGLHLSKKKTEAIANARARRRSAFYMVKRNRISKYDIHRKVWEDLVAIDARRHQPGLAALRGRLYVVGGENKQHRLHSGEAYDPITNKWSPIADLNEGRSHFALAALKGKLYAFGGRGVNGELHSIEVYDPRTDEWTWADDLPWPMHELKAVTYKDAVYLMHKQSLLRYRPPQGEWRTCAKRYVVRADCGAAVLGDQLYVVGGSGDEYDALDIVERYSFATDRWGFTNTMSTGLGTCVANAAGDTLLVVGEGRLEVYDADEDRWTLDIDAPDTHEVTGCF